MVVLGCVFLYLTDDVYGWPCGSVERHNHHGIITKISGFYILFSGGVENAVGKY